MSVRREMLRHLRGEAEALRDALRGMFWTLAAWAFGRREDGRIVLGGWIWRAPSSRRRGPPR